MWILDTGSCVDLVRRDELSAQETRRITAADSPQNLLTANGPTKADQEVSLYVDSCGANTQALVMDDSPYVLSLGKLVQDMKFSFEWKRGRPPVLISPNGRNIPIEVRDYIPMVAAPVMMGGTM